MIIGGTGIITFLGRHIPKSVVRGVQMSAGTMLVAEGVRFVAGFSKFQILKGTAEPSLGIQSVGSVPVGILIGTVAFIITMLFLNNKKLPSGILVILFGLASGLTLGVHDGIDKIRPGLYLPEILPFGFPASSEFTFALIALVLPQLPMTLGNAVIANADLSRDYFGRASEKVTYRSLCFSMSLANLFCFFTGGMPLCHGAGGLAAHYRFGARTAGSNLMIGLIFMALAMFLGPHALAIAELIPFSVLGTLLIFAGSQLAVAAIDIKERKEFFVISVMLGITLALNLAVGFVIGIVMAHILKFQKLTV